MRHNHNTIERLLLLLSILLVAGSMSCGRGGGVRRSGRAVSDAELDQKYFPLRRGSRWIYTRRLASEPEGKIYVEWVPFYFGRNTRGNIQVFTNIWTYHKESDDSEEFSLSEQPNVFEIRRDGIYSGVGANRFKWIPFPVKAGHEFQPSLILPNRRARITGFEDVFLPVGTFPGCARIEHYVLPMNVQRVEGLEPTYIWWFSPTVGLVRRTATDGSETMELVAYEIPGVGANAATDLYIPLRKNLRAPIQTSPAP